MDDGEDDMAFMLDRNEIEAFFEVVPRFLASEHSTKVPRHP
jgi:hypothetical protein